MIGRVDRRLGQLGEQVADVSATLERLRQTIAIGVMVLLLLALAVLGRVAR